MQATRGTPLTPEAPQDTAASGVRPVALVALMVGVSALLIDVLTKIWAVHSLAGEPPRNLIGSLLRLTYVRNPGAAFSTGARLTPLISVIAIVAALVVLWLMLRVGSLAWACAMGLLFAGITGNLVDRVFREPGPMRGHVVDFLQLPHWPVFNVADICINIAVALIVIQSLRGVRLNGARHE